MPASFQFGRADGGYEAIVPAVQTTLVAGTTTLTGGLSKVTPVTGSTAVALPMNAAVGSPITVLNDAATAVTLLVFPPWNSVTGAVAGGKINNGTANASVSLAQSKSATFYPHANGVDYTAVLSA